MKFESEDKFKEFIVTKGCLDTAGNLRFYEKFFLGHAQRAKRLQYLLHFEPAKKVLDVGCGPGHNLIHLPPGSVGVEIHPRLVSFARSLGLEVKSANIEDYIPVEDSSFDIIYCRDVLEHMVAPHKLLREFHRILSQQGRLVLDVRNMDAVGWKSWDSPLHFYAFNKKSLNYLLEKAGFRVKRYLAVSPKLSIIDATIFGKLFARFMPAICVVAEKVPGFTYDKRWPEIFYPAWMRKA